MHVKIKKDSTSESLSAQRRSQKDGLNKFLFELVVLF